MKEDSYIIISLGGSLIVPDQIDSVFLKSFTDTIKSFVEKGFKFMIITGGGKICRKYHEVIKEIKDVSYDDLDIVGIASTRLNAEMVRVIFGDYAHESIVMDPQNIPDSNSSVYVGGGFKPGNSSDMAAVYAARSLGSKKVINLSNIDYVYNKDPNIFSDASPILESNWADFRNLLPSEWNPGLSSPFDPIAAKEAESLGLEIAILNGKNIENLSNYLNGENFVGTVIK